MEIDKNYELIENMVISIDSIYKLLINEYVEIDDFVKDKQLLDEFRNKFIYLSKTSKQIDKNLIDKKDLKILDKLIGLDNYAFEKKINNKKIYNLIYGRELELIRLRLLEIQNEKYQKPLDLSIYTIVKKLNKNLSITFKNILKDEQQKQKK